MGKIDIFYKLYLKKKMLVKDNGGKKKKNCVILFFSDFKSVVKIIKGKCQVNKKSLRREARLPPQFLMMAITTTILMMPEYQK